MTLKLKVFIATVAALAALLWHLLRGRSIWNGRAWEQAQGASRARHETVEANRDADKQGVWDEAERASAGVDGKSVADLYREARRKLGIDGPE